MHFDLGSLIKAGYKEFVFRPIVWSVPVLLLLYVVGLQEFAIAMFKGVVIGVLDIIIMMTGVRRAMPYSDEPKKGLAIMKRYRWYRIAAASSIIILLLRQGFDVIGTCIGLLLTHIFLIINLTIIAKRLNKGGAAKKGE